MTLQQLLYTVKIAETKSMNKAAAVINALKMADGGLE